MADIQPFRGLRYNRRKIDDMSLVVAPPYDVISPAFQEVLYQRHPYNIIRLIKNKSENSYQEASDLLKKWEQEGILEKDDSPCLYLYRTKYNIFGKGPTLTRKGFISLVKLEDSGVGKARPHERTFAAPKDDRFKLLESTRTNLDPIFGLYSDKALEEKIAAMFDGRPDARALDDDGLDHALWMVSDPKEIASIQDAMRSRGFLIADGHHRYEAARMYRDKVREQNPGAGEGPHDYVMIYFTSMEGKGLTILPYHRMIAGLPAINRDAFLKKMEKLFSVMEFPLSGGEQWAQDMLMEGMRKMGKSTRTFGVLLQGESAYYLLAMKEREFMSEEVREQFKGLSAPLLDLDVTVLHQYILPALADGATPSLSYTPKADEAVASLKEGTIQGAILVNPTRMQQVQRITDGGETMPQKSTYFYPKLMSGLAIRSLDG